MQTNIFIGFQYEYSKICLARYLSLKNNYLYEGTGKNFFENKLQKVHCCETVNKYIDMPYKSIWFNDFSQLKLNVRDDVCFIFSKSQSWLLQYKNGEYINFLRKKYPNCKIVLYLVDLISSYYRFDISFFIEVCDAVISYDVGDAEKYGLVYCPLPYSKITIKDNPKIKEFDVYFCGKAKNRLNDIYNIYEYLIQYKLNCRFFITGVPKNEQKYKDITYNKKISYYKNLQYIQKAKYILDIIQKGSKGETLRIKEAVVYGKKIITNNEDIINKAYYTPENICVYKSPNDISANFLNKFQPVKYKTECFDKLDAILAQICNNSAK